MAEEEQTSVTGTVDEATQDYIDTIKNLKENSVDRSKYEALRADNKRLLDSIVNGQSIESQASVNKPSIDELRKQVFKEDQSNLDYVTHALELRDALIANGDPDPFLPYGKKIVPTDDDIAAAERVANVLKECVDYAEGDSQIFTNELQRRTVDTGPRRK